MQSLTETALTRWLGDAARPSGRTIGVLHGEAGPLDGFRLALAVWGGAEAYVGSLPTASPRLVAAFAEELRDEAPDLDLQFGEEEEVLDRADWLLARPSSAGEAAALRSRCDERGIPPGRRLVQPPIVSVGLLDGHETDDERERLAEDMLLFDGTGRRRLAVVWAPRDLAPDPYLESMARFRGAYPVHPDTPGTLQMQQAFLDAQDEPHAYAEGLEFLVSRGEPAPQKAGHIRWSEYDDLADGVAWGEGHAGRVYALIARAPLHDQISTDLPLRRPGGVHVPPLNDPAGTAIVEALAQPYAPLEDDASK